MTDDELGERICQRDGCEEETWSKFVDYCSSACEQSELVKAMKSVEDEQR